MSETTNKFSPEVRARAVRMVLDHENDYTSRWAAATSIAGKIGCSTDSLLEWLKKADMEAGCATCVPAEVEAKLKALVRENRELRQANEILRKASAYFCSGGAGRPTQNMIAFIDDPRGAYGIEPICRLLPIARSTYHEHALRLADPSRSPARIKRDCQLVPEIKRVFSENFEVYGRRRYGGDCAVKVLIQPGALSSG